jgi:hypothetical protein
MSKFIERNHIVPAVWPVDLNTGDNPGDYVSLKNYKHLTVFIFVKTMGATSAVTMKQAKNVAGTGEKALSFVKYYMTGAKWKYNTLTVAEFAVGETVTGAGGASGVVAEVGADYLLVYTVNATAVVDAEVLTGGTSGAKAVADGAGVNEDILLGLTCASTFTIPAVVLRSYVIEIEASMLDVEAGFDCVRVQVEDPGAAALGAAVYILSEPRYAGIPMETAIYD